MCGIVGIISNKKIVKQDIINMSKKIKHRGPDDEGYYISSNVAFAHRRLSIIDIKGGNQPLWSNDKRYVTIYNGEIYNFKELKKELKDYEFKTQSDTEILIAGYLKWGKKLPKHLRGMFAFAIWDTKDKKLFCARDPFGIKPFYYYIKDDLFMFASELKAFLGNSEFKKEFNEKLLSSYMSFSFVPTYETFFKNVYHLSPGSILEYKNNKLKISKYYKIKFQEKINNYEKTVNKINNTMKQSVKYHLISDVEVGSFLSSGIDSSYIVCLAKPQKTYTIGYDNKKYDESGYVKELVKKLHIQNKLKIVTKEEYMKVLPKAIYYMDEPASDPAFISLYFVSKLASKDVKVVLSGEGADEFFGGYNYYREIVDVGWYNKIPYGIRHFIGNVANLFPSHKGINFLVRRGNKIEDEYIGINKVWDEKEIKQVLKVKMGKSNKEITKPFNDLVQDKDDLIKMQNIDINFWLLKDILQKADRMTMANSIESRVPFIDKKVFKIASSLCPLYKVTKENTKIALRDAAKKVIPTEAYKKKKLGFPVPLRDWMYDKDVYEEIKAKFLSKTAQEFFNTDILLQMLEDHYHKVHDNYRKVWNIYCFLVWYNIYFENQITVN